MKVFVIDEAWLGEHGLERHARLGSSLCGNSQRLVSLYVVSIEIVLR